MWVHLVKKKSYTPLCAISYTMLKTVGCFMPTKKARAFSKASEKKKQLGIVIPIKQSPGGWQRQASITQINW